MTNGCCGPVGTIGARIMSAMLRGAASQPIPRQATLGRGPLAGGMTRILAVALLGGCAPELDWREVRPSGTAVVALLPCKPQSLARSVSLAGRDLRLSMLACKAGGLTWGLASGDVGEPSHVMTVLEALRVSAVGNLQGVVTRSSGAAVRGATPNEAQGLLEVRGRRPDGTVARGQFLLFAHGTQVFEVMVIGADLPDAAMETYFGSVRVSP